MIPGARVKITGRPDLPSDTGTIAEPGPHDPAGFSRVLVDRRTASGRKGAPVLDLVNESRLSILLETAEEGRAMSDFDDPEKQRRYHIWALHLAIRLRNSMRFRGELAEARSFSNMARDYLAALGGLGATW